jgi:Flp pilus assembly protein TadG
MLRCRPNPRPGAAATELALWLPLLGLMFVVALDYCRIFYYAQTVQNCAWAGAMYASGTSWRDGGSADDAAAAVRAAVAEGVSLNPPLSADQVTVSYSGSRTTVTVNYPFAMLSQWPLLGSGASGTVTITRSVQMNVMPKPGS